MINLSPDFDRPPYKKVGRYLLEQDFAAFTDEEEILSVKWKDGVLHVTRMNHEENGIIGSRNHQCPVIPTLRLADYFVVIGYKNDAQKGGTGEILQRFPTKDWEDVPFIAEIELFCQPQGWRLSAERQEPKFFVSVLTDVNLTRHFCACLSFHEPIYITPSRPIDEEEDIYGCVESYSMSMCAAPSAGGTNHHHHTIMYAPKCLVLMSRIYQIETFRNCLGTIYTVHSENMDIKLETLVGTLLGNFQVPLTGGQQIRFSLGGGDRQFFQPPINYSIPVTSSSVAQLFQQLGINNVLTLFCAVMTEHKILFHSNSITRLTDACHALTALMFPFRYIHIYVPLLPSEIIEVVSSPTPFMLGVHSSARSMCSDLMDVTVVDLDGGSITVPDGISIPTLPDLLATQVQEQLSYVLHPELTSADFAFPPLVVKSSNSITLDKEIRAVFLRLFAQLFQGYRSCLVIIRIHAKAVITFHKSKFLGRRGLIDSEFVIRLLDCMFFNQFILERGSPWRACDIWDDLYNETPEKLKAEAQDSKLTLVHIQELGQLLLINENPSAQQYVPKIMKPPDGAHSRIHVKQFPTFDCGLVQELINEGISKQALARFNNMTKHSQPRIVPFGPSMCGLMDYRQHQIVDNSARRLEVLRTCIAYIFDNKISDARKSFHAVTRALKSQSAKMVLCQELGSHITGAKAVLNAQQFDMVVKLMHCALQDCSVMDEHGIAGALLPLACEFYRKLCNNVKQFAYTCIQEHPVWKNQQFWESVFYTEVEKEIKKLYLPPRENSFFSTNNYSSVISNIPHRGSVELEENLPVLNSNNPVEYSALEIAAEQMRLAQNIDPEKMKTNISIEESTIVAQAVHFLSRMTYMLVPLDTPTRRPRDHNHYGFDEERVSNITSMAESDSLGGESGFEDQDTCVESGTSVKKFIGRFIDKVCVEGGVSEEYIRRTQAMVATCVDMHIEDCENVYKETKRLPPIQKPKIPNPALLPGELMVLDSIRVYLLPDGREDGTGGSMGGPVILPAEGAIFFTNYRLIFKGTPCDPYACEQTVIRSFPISSLTKEKRITVQYLAHLDQLLQEGLQLRSATFQLMKLAFDEEVSSDSIDVFRKTLSKYRHPQDISGYFAFAGQQLVPTAPLVTKDKNTTLKGFTKKAIIYTAKKAGLKTKPSKRQKYELRSWSHGNGGTLPAVGSKLQLPIGGVTSPLKHGPPSRENLDGDDVSLSDDEFPHSPMNTSLNSASDSKSMEKLMERSYYKDWKRMGLGTLHKTVNLNASTILSKAESFRISYVNCNYMICRSYPALLVVPNLISEESIKKVARCYRSGRFPVPTWKHPRSRALLVRGASFNSKGLMAFLKGHPHHAGSGVSETTAHVEHENFLRAIVNATPLAVVKPGSTWMSDSTFSLDSISNAIAQPKMGVHHHHQDSQSYSHQITPEVGRKGNSFMKAMNTLRYAGTSGGKGIYGNWTTARPRKNMSQPIIVQPYLSQIQAAKEDLNGISDVPPIPPPRIQKAALYIFGEKSQIKGIKTDHNSKIEYVPVDFVEVRQTRTSFKKLMRACLPSNGGPDAENSFLKAFEGTDWLNQLTSVMWLSGAVVDLIDDGSSVILCLEDGTDITSQITSIAQLCLDPYYRTIEGFQTLLEKEWLAFGYRFSHRNNVTGAEGPSSNPGFAPIFLQFLDIVHQLLHQFPLSFEFNQYFIKFLAFHSVSGRFRTFLADNELERVEYGFMAADNKRGSLPRPYKGVDTGSDDETLYMMNTGKNPNSHYCGQSVFEYIERHHAKSCVFFNLKYDKNSTAQVLRPMRHTSALQIWEYFTKEDLSIGASYDFEVAYVELQGDEDQPAEGAKDIRKCVMAGYDIVDRHIPDAFRHYLAKHHQLEQDRGRLPQKWKQIFDKLEAPPTEDGTGLIREPSITTQQVRALGRSLHKKSTMDILVRGKLVRSSDISNVYNSPHRFEKHTFTTLANCDTCGAILLAKTGLRCLECGAKCHDKCADGVPKCRVKCVKGGHGSGMGSNNAMNTMSLQANVGSDSLSGSSHTPSVQNSHPSYYDEFSSNVTENRTHEGYLYKRGALLKGWKQRWFVLDSTKHQLRYYDAMEDSHSKGFIELSEVVNVTSGTPAPGAPKKSEDKCFFDIRTTRRIYNFCASDSSSAQGWIEKIQACL
ncbi:Myotubularin-related protein 13 [Folsomia candida]|uniref:Myotubularin-related protein 13 n=1 Tax=Folsomia candida TaxID=158441 RepID=A0A226EMF7_FOLCA|nr:Myotubularin-related protein 13 [Folsomia candida]